MHINGAIDGKRCTKCGEVKHISLFHKHKKTKDGRLGHCKSCHALYGKRYASENKEKIKRYRDEWRKANPEKDAQSKRNYRVNNRTKYLAQKSEYAKAHRAEYNRDTAAYRAAKLRATTKLGELEELAICEIYSLAALRQKLTGVRLHVDHFYPLVSDIVCGLHCIANLRIISAFENQSKSNRLIHEEV